jgi:hypothetical protein
MVEDHPVSMDIIGRALYQTRYLRAQAEWGMAISSRRKARQEERTSLWKF